MAVPANKTHTFRMIELNKFCYLDIISLLHINSVCIDFSLLDGLVVNVSMYLDQMRDHIAAPTLLRITIDPLDESNRLLFCEIVVVELELHVRRGNQGPETIVLVRQIRNRLPVGTGSAVGLVGIREICNKLLDELCVLLRRR